ncbi:hypothetical protein STCU_02012 [Strigomonas culicis]|nr:hypothetical protein STCU_02012 [Strigomonas culicis]|eukprot:EPY33754.1 hypothetical protein STCU_02012 [Strigomonas culicis]
MKKDLISKLNQHRDINIFVGHGINDPLISPSYPKEYVEILRKNGYNNIKLKYYDIAHSICTDELKDISNAIKEMITKKSITT